MCSDTCLKGKRLCTECQIPICTVCQLYLMKDRPTLCPIALANDLMVFYAPEEMYTDGGLTVMEMICASPCITSMICFSLEVKYGNTLNENACMNRHRVGARGNATTFQLPWELLLQELQKIDADEDGRQSKLSLPRVGEELYHVVHVLLKTSDEEKRNDLKHFVHQATVRRHKVIQCILNMKKTRTSCLHASQGK